MKRAAGPRLLVIALAVACGAVVALRRRPGEDRPIPARRAVQTESNQVGAPSKGHPSTEQCPEPFELRRGQALASLERLKALATLGDWQAEIPLLCSLEATLLERDSILSDAVRLWFSETQLPSKKGMIAILLASNPAEIKTLVTEWQGQPLPGNSPLRHFLLYGMLRKISRLREVAESAENIGRWQRRLRALSAITAEYPQDSFSGLSIPSEAGAAGNSLASKPPATNLNDFSDILDPQVRRIVASALADSDREVEGLAVSMVIQNVQDSALASEIVTAAVARNDGHELEYLRLVGSAKLNSESIVKMAEFTRSHANDLKTTKVMLDLLGTQGSSEADRAILELYHQTAEPDLKAFTLEVAGATRSEEFVRLVRTECGNPHPMVRAAALKRLSRLCRHDEAQELIRNCAMNDQAPGVRLTCVEILASKAPKSQADTDTLRRIAVGDADPRLRVAASSAVSEEEK